MTDITNYRTDELTALFMCLFIGHILGVDALSEEIEHPYNRFICKKTFFLSTKSKGMSNERNHTEKT